MFRRAGIPSEPMFSPLQYRDVSKGSHASNNSIERINMPKLAECRGAEAKAPIAPKLVEVTFSLNRPAAEKVYLCGDFNQWSPASLRMIRHDGNGHWEKRLTLMPGRYQYKFVVDGEWVHDPNASENVPNHHGSLNSLVEVQE